jgi:hypothetical protein
VLAVGVGLVCICWICILSYDESESKFDFVWLLSFCGARVKLSFLILYIAGTSSKHNRRCSRIAR